MYNRYDLRCNSSTSVVLESPRVSTLSRPPLTYGVGVAHAASSRQGSPGANNIVPLNFSPIFSFCIGNTRSIFTTEHLLIQVKDLLGLILCKSTFAL